MGSSSSRVNDGEHRPDDGRVLPTSGASLNMTSPAGRSAMADVPETRYAKSGDIHIAYHVVGSGPIDIVWVPGFVSHIELMWQNPGMAHLLRRLASFSRLVMFDKPGT